MSNIETSVKMPTINSEIKSETLGFGVSNNNLSPRGGGGGGGGGGCCCCCCCCCCCSGGASDIIEVK